MWVALWSADGVTDLLSLVDNRPADTEPDCVPVDVLEKLLDIVDDDSMVDVTVTVFDVDFDSECGIVTVREAVTRWRDTVKAGDAVEVRSSEVDVDRVWDSSAVAETELVEDRVPLGWGIVID